MPKKVLVIDDDPDVGQILKVTLVQAGYKVTVATSGKEGLERVRDNRPDLVLLDVMMPGTNGWQVCSYLREFTDVPVIMLTVLGGQGDTVKGLLLGADDYIVKPWSNRELLARIHAVLRRVGTSLTKIWQQTCSYGDLVIDVRGRKVTIGDRKIHLTPTEYRLLTYLARRPGRIVPSSELIAQIWGVECKQDIIRLRWHVHNLRRKIEKDPKDPQCLLGRYGIGYYFADGRQDHQRFPTNGHESE